MPGHHAAVAVVFAAALKFAATLWRKYSFTVTGGLYDKLVSMCQEASKVFAILTISSAVPAPRIPVWPG